MAQRLLTSAHDVVVFDNLSRHGSEQNLNWLRDLGLKHFIKGDIRDKELVDRVIRDAKPVAIFHLAGQVAMTTSMQNPRLDFETNVVGSINILEAVRQNALSSAIIYASSNKVYGDLSGVRLQEQDKRYAVPDFPQGIDESAALDFRTPYGCSKGSADQYMLDYARNYGLNTVVFRHSTIYGGRQFATIDQGWVGWFCEQAIRQQKNPAREPFTISGNGKQVRDLLFIDDAIDAYLAAVKHVDHARGQAFNIGGGIGNSSSLLELFDDFERILSVNLRYTPTDWRKGDQKFFVANLAKATKIMAWRPKVDKDKGIEMICQWVQTIV